MDAFTRVNKSSRKLHAADIYQICNGSDRG